MELKEKLSSQRDCCNCSTEEAELTEPLSESSNSLSIPETDCAESLAPDGGWGWVVCLASFLCNVIVDGIAFSFGVILQEYATYFNSSVSSISLANSLYLGIHAIEGPIVGALINKYGCRAVAITGGVIGTLPFILSTFSPSVIVFQVTYGVLGGIAFGMIYLPTIVGVGLYFRRKRAIATGISVAGTGFGAIIFAPFTEYLLENLGWKGAHIVFAGLMLQCCVFGSLMRPLTARSKGLKASSSTSTLTEQKCLLHNTSEDSSVSGAEGNVILPQHGEGSTSLGREVKRESRTKLWVHHLDKTIHSAMELTTHRKSLTESSRLHASAFVTHTTSTTMETVPDVLRPLYAKDIFYSGSVYNLSADQYFSDSIPSSTNRGYQSCLRKLPKPIAEVLIEMTDPCVLKHHGMQILCAANLFFMIGFYIPVVLITNRARQPQYSIDKEKAALLVSIMGICNTVGRLLFGVLFVLFPKLPALQFNNVCMVLTSLSVLCIPLTDTYIKMAVVIALYGLFSGAFISLVPIIICELIGVQKLTNGFGLICMIRGVTIVFGPPLGGWLFDKTGNYDATFYMAGASMLIGACLSLLLHLNNFRY